MLFNFLAVTLGVMVAGQINIIRGVLYMIVQFVGAILGAFGVWV